MSDESSDKPTEGEAAPTIPMASEPSIADTKAYAGAETDSGERLLGDRYELMGLVGSGGMGNVYRARDTVLEDIVALKTLDRRLAEDDSAAGQFRREVKLARRVTHRNVARTFDIGFVGDVMFLTMEFVEGEPLSSLMKRTGPMSIDQAVPILGQICAGLQEAHSANVLHRDLKPQNVMIAESDGRVVLTDFGIARAARKSETQFTVADGPLGTPAYMAPEQVDGSDGLDHRADIYALGVMMFEMFSAELPWQEDTPMATALARVLHEPPCMADYGTFPDNLVDIVDRALAKEPADRFDDAVALRRELVELLENEERRDTMPASELTKHSRHDGEREPSTGELSSVAVLPFRNRGDEDDAYLAEGVTEELIDELSTYDRLRLRPLGAVTQYSGETVDPRKAGAELDVHVVVDGSLTRLGDQIRIRVSVTSVAEGFQIWSGKFTGEADELFELTERAGSKVAGVLTSQKAEERHSRPTDAAAVDLYMQARYEMRRAWHLSMDHAIELYEQALERAPADPRILTGLATAWSRRAYLRMDGDDEAIVTARNYASEAIEEAAGWADPYYAMAIVDFNAGDIASALRYCQLALERESDFADALDLAGRIIAETGPMEVAVDHLERALAINPSLSNARWDLARIHALRGDWEASDSALGQPSGSQEDRAAHYVMRSRLDLWRDVPIWADEPIPEFEREHPTIVMSEVFQRVARGDMPPDDHLEALWKLREELTGAVGRRASVVGQLSTEIAIVLGWRDRAFEQLAEAVKFGLIDLMWLKNCPVLEPLRDTPEFERAEGRVAGRVDAITQMR